MFELLFLLICAVIVLGGTYFALRTFLSGDDPAAKRQSTKRRLEEFFGAESD